MLPHREYVSDKVTLISWLAGGLGFGGSGHFRSRIVSRKSTINDFASFVLLIDYSNIWIYKN
jgi:hypothetical protein